MFLAVGLIRAHCDRNRARGVAQNDVAGRRSVGGLGPPRPEAGFHLVQNCRSRLLGLCGSVHLRRVAGVGRCAIERAVFPIRQHHPHIPEVALPRPSGDGGKSLLRHRQVHDPAQIETVGRGLRARALRQRYRRQARHCNSRCQESFHHGLPLAVESSSGPCNGSKPSTFFPIIRPILSPIRLSDVAIFFGKISCTCRIQSYRSSRNNFWRRLVAAPDTACNCWMVQLVMQ
jgi:hypothetical protein